MSRPNLAMTRPEAVDLAITVGLLLRGRIKLRPRGAGYDATLPVEDVATLAETINRQAFEIHVLDEVNADVRQQRDYWRGVAEATWERYDRLIRELEVVEAERDHAQITAIRLRFPGI